MTTIKYVMAEYLLILTAAATNMDHTFARTKVVPGANASDHRVYISKLRKVNFLTPLNGSG